MKKITTILILLLINLSQLHAQQPIKTHNHNAISFIENGGQWPGHVLYKTDLDAGSIWLDKSGILYQFKDYSAVKEAHLGKHQDDAPSLREHLLYAKFLGSNPNPKTESKNQNQEYYNYYIGNDTSKWASDVRGYGSIVYYEIYQGIDFLMFEKNGDIKYEFHVSANANPNEIVIEYHGHKIIEVLNDGNLRLVTSLGELIEENPYAYQIINGREVEVECRFKLLDSVLTYEIGAYDTHSDLIIDPTLMFATYSGSVTDNFGMTATYGHDGTAYSAGVVFGNGYPTPDPLSYNVNSNFSAVNNVTYGITDVFVSKYNSDGTNMMWTTYLGGGNDTTGTETAHSLICDSSNNVYVYGGTSSTDFPVSPGAFQSSHAGGMSNSNFYYNGIFFTDQGSDIYVAKISSDGTSLLGSTYIGGTGNDGLNYNVNGGTYNSAVAYDSLTTNYGDQFRGELILDTSNNVLVVTQTRSIDFPTVNSFQGSLAGEQDAVVFKLSSDFTNLIFSSYFGGTNNDAGHSISLNSQNEIIISGGTSSNNIPGTGGALNPTFQGGKADGFIAKISPDASSLLQSTYIGTPSTDQCYFTDVDFNDNIVVFGNSDGTSLITAGVYSNPNSGQFIQSLNSELSSVNYATVFGSGSGTMDISPSAFEVDEYGNIYCTGWGANILQATPLSGMPISPDAFQSTPPNGFDFYLLVLGNNAQSLMYGSYLGGSSANEHVDGGTSRFDSDGVLYQSICAGCNGYSDFPTTPDAWSSTNLSSNCNNAVVKFDMRTDVLANFDLIAPDGSDSGITLYPNPSSDHFKLDLGEVDPSTVIVTITNMFGQAILHYNDLKDEFLELSTQRWSKGIYFTSVNDRNTGENLFVSKLIIE